MVVLGRMDKPKCVELGLSFMNIKGNVANNQTAKGWYQNYSSFVLIGTLVISSLDSKGSIRKIQ